MNARWRKWQLALTVILTGSLMGFMPDLGCISMAARNLGRLSHNINPCGTILNCDPVEYDLLMNSFPDWSKDPTCTIPGLCGGVFPFGTGGNTTNTNTNTNTNPNTNTNTNTNTNPIFGGF